MVYFENGTVDDNQQVSVQGWAKQASGMCRAADVEVGSSAWVDDPSMPRGERYLGIRLGRRS